MEGIAGEHEHRAAFEPGKARDHRAAEIGVDLEERSLVDDGFDDRPHLVDLAAAARHRLHQRLLRTFRIVVAGNCRRQLVHRRRQIGQEALDAFERLFLGIDGIVDAAGAGLDVRAAEFLLGQVLSKPLHHRRTGDEHRGVLGHDRVMRGRQPRRAEARDRAEAKADHRHAGHVRNRVRVRARTADAAGQIGRAPGFDGFHGAAAAGAFDQADDRQAEIMRHLLGHQRLGRDRGVGRAAAHGEIVADHDHGSAVDLAAAEHAVRGRQMLEFVLFVVFGDTGDRADLVEAVPVDQMCRCARER